MAARFASGKRFAPDLPQEQIADDDELATIAEAAEAGLASQSGPGAHSTRPLHIPAGTDQRF